MTTPIQALLERVSTPANLLQEPAPSAEELEQIVQAGLCAPDHGALRPWRFISIRGEAREALAQVFCDTSQRNQPDISEAELKDIYAKPLRAPLIVVVVAAVEEHPKIPSHEQILSAGAAAQNLLLASNALGYGSIWLTGSFATDPYVYQQLGLQVQERIIGFIYIGTPSSSAAKLVERKQQNRPTAKDFIIDWPQE